VNLAWVFLPAAVFWSSVVPVHGKLVVSGPLDRGPRCAYLTVDPVSRNSALRKGACTMYHFRTFWNGHQPWTNVYVGSRLAFRYQDASDTRPVSTTSGDALWLYDVFTERGAILQRWSLATGTLQQEIRFPIRLWRPVIAANSAGAWLMAATNGGEDGTDRVALWHVSSRGVSTLQRGARAALWMAARGRALWLETVTGYHMFKLWRYDGTRGRLLWTRQQSYLMSPTLGGGSLWSVSARYCAKNVAVVRIDPSTGATTTETTVPALDCNQLGPGAYYRGSFWFVDGNKLFRVP
jgi:hypothetical protein